MQGITNYKIESFDRECEMGKRLSTISSCYGQLLSLEKFFKQFAVSQLYVQQSLHYYGFGDGTIYEPAVGFVVFPEQQHANPEDQTFDDDYLDYIADFLFKHPCVISRQTYVLEKQHETFIRGKCFEVEKVDDDLELNMGYQGVQESSESREEESEQQLAPVKFLLRKQRPAQDESNMSAMSKLSTSSLMTQTRIDHEFTMPNLANDLLVDDGNIQLATNQQEYDKSDLQKL